jgi:hypothetical protein
MNEDWLERRLAMLKAAPKKRADKKEKYAYVPLPWGYRVFAIAGRGAPIVLHVLREQKINGHGDVKITAKLLKEWGISRKIRNHTLVNMEAAGLMRVTRRGKKFRGCPSVTMLNVPER